MAIKHSSDMTV